MKKFFNISISLLLSLSMLASMFVGIPASASEIDSGVSGSVTWSLSDEGVLTISGTGDMADYHASTGYTPWYSHKADITKVVVSEGVTTVGDYAFADCSAVTSATVADSVTYIGSHAFANCSGLVELTMPCSAIIYNDAYTFADCTALQKITLTAGTGVMPPYTIDDDDGWTGFYGIQLEDTYYNNTPWYKSGCPEVVLEEGVKSVSEYAFYDCTSLKRLVVLDTECTIYDSAYTVDKATTIAGFTGSPAEAFANKYSRTFEPLGNPECLKGNHDYTSEVVKDATCTEAGEVKYTCKNCDNFYTDVILAKGHTVVTDEAVAPTCTEAGLTEGSHCSVCEEVLIAQEEVGKLGHDYKGVVTKEASCKEPGVTTYTCTRCSDTYEDPITPTGEHTVVTDEAVAPTCTETGLTEGSHCSVCGDVLVAQEVVEAKGHTVVTDEAVAPTCTETGLTEGSHCSVCNEVLVAQEEIKANGHTVVTDEAVAPTCTETGLTEGSHCSVCNEVLVAQEEVGKLGHNYESAITTDPTCKVAGVRTYTCTRCGDTYTEPVEPTGAHTVVTDEAVAPTCTENGLTEGSHCSVCGDVIVAQEVIEAKGHTVVTDEAVAPTCTETGLTEGSHCSVCEEVLVAQEVIEAKGHTVVTDEAVAPTCTETGLTEGSHCSVCGEVLVAQQVVEALGHKEVTDEAVAPTCTKTGLTEGSHCSVCGEVLVAQQVVETLGHKEVTDEAVAPTCTKTGLTDGSHCSVCGEVLVAQKVVEALGHKEVTDEAVAPTCTKNGLTEGSHCSVCGEVLVAQEVVEALGHKEVIDEGKDATCTEAGLTEGKHCSVCEEVLVAQETIPAKGHTEDVTPGYAATCTEAGLTDGVKCTVCEEVLAVQTVIPALGHDYVADVTYPTFTEGGYTTYTCSRCGDTHTGDYTEAIKVDVSGECGKVAETLEWGYNRADAKLYIIGEGDMATYASATATPWVNYKNYATDVIIQPGTTSISTNAFYSFQKVTNVELPDTVKTLGNNAFAFCKALTDIEIPDSVTTMGANMFMSCAELKNVVVGENVAQIGSNSFKGCPKLTNLTIASSTKLFNNDTTFGECKSIKNIVITKGTGLSQNYNSSDVGGDVYYRYTPWYINNGKANIVFEEGVTTIGKNMFYQCKSLKTIDLPSTIRKIGHSAFYACTVLGEVEIPDSVIEIEPYAFYYCKALKSVKIPSSVTTIGTHAFDYASVLEYVYIPASVQNIGALVFQNNASNIAFEIECNSYAETYLTSAKKDYTLKHFVKDGVCVRCGESVEAVDSEHAHDFQFAGFDDKQSTFACDCGEAYSINEVPSHSGTSGTVKWAVFKNLGEMYVYGEGELDDYVVIFDAPWCDLRTYIRHLVVGSGITKIGDNVFYGFPRLQSAVIKPGVKSIGRGAFYVCGQLVSLTIPDTVETIGNHAFAGCVSLKKLTIPASTKCFNAGGVFYNLAGLETVVLTKGTGVAQNYALKENQEDTYYKFTPWGMNKSCKTVIVGEGVNLGENTFYSSTCTIK